MDRRRLRQLASKGGRAAHLRGTAHEWTREEAREAGRKGGAILLSSGDGPKVSRVHDIAATLADIATQLDELKEGRTATDPRALTAMRRSIQKANGAIDYLENRSGRAFGRS